MKPSHYIFLERFSHGNDSTLGFLNLGGHPFCFICEDEHRKEKIAGETRIPSGTYEIKLNIDGGMNRRYRELFPDLHQGMLEITDIPNFSNVYIHIGNDDDDTAGCPLPGLGATVDHINGGGTVQRSKEAYEALYSVVLQLLEEYRVFLVVSDHVRRM